MGVWRSPESERLQSELFQELGAVHRRPEQLDALWRNARLSLATAKCSSNGGLTPTSFPDTAQSPAFIQSLASQCQEQEAAHQKWANGKVFSNGLTTALTPNTQVLIPGFPNPVNLVTNDENQGGYTYAALTADSYHPGGVNALLADGSVRFIKSSVNGQAWRALGTIAGGEVISADAY